MANDITKAIEINAIKNGTIIHACNMQGIIVKSDTYVSNRPTIEDIQNKYDNRFDNPSYYYGGGGGGIVDGGDINEDGDVLGV